jgi:23S rRNA (cytosine1962-C5)-methyltransferase
MEIKNDLLFVEKPSGINTHRSESLATWEQAGSWGMCELLERDLGRKVYVVHRLDQSTSGAMVFALTPEKASWAAELFEKRLIKKTYAFVTDRRSEVSEFRVCSKIERVGNNYVSEICPEEVANAITDFIRVKRTPFFELWKALPRTGRPHQIRLHASQKNLPIYGDTLYGGTAAQRIYLHSTELVISEELKSTSPLPRLFERLGFLKDKGLEPILNGIDRRQRLYDFFKTPVSALRLSHLESPDYRLDLFGSCGWVYWYSSKSMTPRDLERWQTVSRLLGRPLWIRQMLNRGAENLESVLLGIENPPARWTFEENNLKFEARCDQGLSPGLFLDQRSQRKWVLENSQRKYVLNLFAYTCGFSVAAAAGGARQVTSVDASKNFIEWGKVNFQLNQKDPSHHEFFVSDVGFFLDRTLAKKRKFDLIILDPPSFGRSKEGVFKIQKNLPKILAQCESLLAHQGQILVSSNYEDWDYSQFEQVVKSSLHSRTLNYQRNLPSIDFELPGQTPLLKSTLVTFPK